MLLFAYVVEERFGGGEMSPWNFYSESECEGCNRLHRLDKNAAVDKMKYGASHTSHFISSFAVAMTFSKRFITLSWKFLDVA
jgi:hypothetical protein